MSAPPVVLSISGFDPSSGAGVTADLKTIAAHGCYGVGCITALTVQSTVGVRRSLPLAGEVIRQTVDELADDLHVAAVRIGMLGNAEAARAVSESLRRFAGVPVVLDPILASSSGAALLDAEGLQLLRGPLLLQASVVTPNLDEAEALTGLVVRDLSQMRRAAEMLREMGARAVVVKGGHLEGEETVDLLLAGSGFHELRARRVESTATHGTGCAFATALACQLARGVALPEAAARAKRYVGEAIAHAYPLGRGHGPMNHLFAFSPGER